MKLYFMVLGSSIATCRGDFRAGTTLADGWSEPFLQKAGLSMPRTVAASQTPALLVEHGVVVVGPLSQSVLLAPIGGRRHRLDGARRDRGPSDSGMSASRDRHLEERHLVRLRIEDRHVVGRVFRRAVQRAIGVDRRIAPVGRNQIVQIFVRRGPLPGGDRRHCVRCLAAAAARVFGSSPLATRSVQSPKYLNGTPPNWPASRLVIISPDCPDWMRRIQASSPELNLPNVRRDGAGRLPGRADGSRCSRHCSSASASRSA